MPSGRIGQGKSYHDHYSILNFPDWRALEAFAKKIPLGNTALTANSQYRSNVEKNLNSKHFGLFGKNPKSYDEAMQRDKFVYYDEYKKIKEKVEKKILDKIQKSSEAEIMKPKFVYNDKQIGEFIYERAAMSLKPKIYWYCPSEERVVDAINEKIYLYVPSLKKVVENEKVLKEGNLMVLEDKKRSLVINAIKSGDKFVEVVYAVKVTKEDGKVEYLELKGEDTLKKAREKGILDVTSSNKKVYLYKEKKPKEFKAIKIIVALTKGGLTNWENDFYTGVATGILVEILESLEYSVEVIVALGGGRCNGSQCIKFPLNFNGLKTHGRRYFLFTAKKFDDQLDKDGLLYTVSDPSFHNIKFISLLNSFFTLFGDSIDTETGDPSGTWHGIEEEDMINPIGAYQKAIDYKKGNRNVLDFFIHKIGSEQEIIEQVTNIALECENMNLEALRKYKTNEFKYI
jgi:hypothetical protein